VREIDNVAGVAAYLGVSTKFVRRHALELGASKVGAHLRFRRSRVDSYLDAGSLSARRGAVTCTPIKRSTATGRT